MRKMNKVLAMLLALIMVLQMVPAIGAAAATSVTAAYVSDAGKIDASKVGYYWDAENLYYANGASYVAYDLDDLGVVLTDYNQKHTVTIGGAAVEVSFAPAKGAQLGAFTPWSHTGFTYNLGVDGTTVSLDNETTIDAATNSDPASDASMQSTNTAAWDHSKDLNLHMTLQFDALPENPRGHHGVFDGTKVTGCGLNMFLSNRVAGSSAETMLLYSIHMVGDALTLYVANSKAASGYGYPGVDLGVGLGEKFDLDFNWYTDGSADVLVNGNFIVHIDDATRVLGGQTGQGFFFGLRYPANPGDTKFEISNVSVHEVAPATVADDVAETDLATVVAGVEKNVFGAATLPAAVQYAHGAMPIYWTSSNPAVLSNDGKVVAMPAADTKVTLTAACAGAEASVEVIVKANDYIAPSSALYSFPAQIQANQTVNVTINGDVYTIDGTVASATLLGSSHTANIDHVVRDLLFKQTVTIDAMPEQAYTSAAEASTGGFTMYIIDRVNGQGADCQTVALTIVNEGGKLYGYLNANTKFDLGVALGDTFEVMLRWNTDNSAAVYVNGVCVGKAANATIVRGWNGNDQAGFKYNAAAEGTVKITWTDAAVYEDPALAAIEAFNALIASMDLSAVYGSANLPAEVAGAPIYWFSSNVALLSDGGKVVAIPAADTQVTLTATCAGVSKDVVATVKANDYIAPVDALYTFPALIQANQTVNVTINGDVYTIDGNVTSATLLGSSHTANIDHVVRDLLFKQTVTIDAMPEQAYTSAAEASTGGFTMYIIDRVNGQGADCQTAALTIVNEGGKLYGYLNANTKFDLGVALGDTFEVMLRWNTDNSAAVYVNGVCVGKADNATIVRGWNGNDQAGFKYNAAAEGTVKITWTDAAVYADPALVVVNAFNELIASLDFSAVNADIVLPTEVSGAAITWSSSNPAVLAADGKVTKPAVNTKVILTASCAGATATVEATVLADAVKAGALYTTDVTKEAPGYYWDAVNIYFVDAERNIVAYNMANYGIALTDYFQTVSGNFGGKLVDLTLIPTNGELLDSFGHHNVQGVPNSFNVTVDKKVFTLDSAANTADPTVSGANTIYSQLWSGNNANLSHANDLYLEQTITIHALPEKTVTHNGVFVGGTYYANGFSFFMSNRAAGQGNCVTFLATIQNEGNGKLTLYVANASAGSAHGSTMIDLGKQVGDTFTLGVRWDADGSAKIFVDGAMIADLDVATRVLSYALGVGNTYGMTYANLEGDYKITVQNVNLYPAAPETVAEDTAISSLEDIVGAMNLNNVMGNLELPMAFAYAHGAMPITWTSSNTDVLDNTGKIVNHPDVPTQVTLTAAAAGQTVSVVATVKPNTFIQPIDAIYQFPTNLYQKTVKNFDISTSGVYVYDSATTVTDSSVGATLTGVGSNAAIDHTKDMVLQYTVRIDALPDAPYSFNYSSGNGVLFNLSDRLKNEDGSNAPGGDLLFGSIVNINEKLYLHIGQGAAIDLGKTLGETFTVTVAWNADDSAQVYVDGKCLASQAVATVEQNYAAGDNLNFYYNNNSDVAKFTLTDVAVYEPVSEDVKNALYALTTAEVVESAFADKVTGALPTKYTVAGIEFNVSWIAVDGSVNADGSVVKGAEDKTVTLTAIVGGAKLASCQKVIAGKEKIAIDPTSGIVNRLELKEFANDKYLFDTVNNGVTSNVAADGNVFTFAGNGVLGGKTAVAVFDHAAYDILIQQTLKINALTENAEMFTLDNKVYTLNGYRFLVSDRLDGGVEVTVDAAIQYVDGQLVLVFANGAKTDEEYVSVALGKTLGDTFTLSLMWNKNDSVIVFVDGAEIATVADGTRDSSWSGSDCTTLYSNDANAAFVVSNYNIYDLGAVAMVGETAYTDLQAAINAAAQTSYKVVSLINNAYVGDIEIPAGVILDLADYRLVAENVASFGHIVDGDKTTRGSLVVKGDIELASENAQMPIYHVEQQCYYFFDATANALGTKGTNSKITFGFAPQFADSYAYHVMGKTAPNGFNTTSGLNVIIELNWTGNEGDAVRYVLSQDMIREYGNTAFEFAGKLTAAMMLKVTGAEKLDYGSEVFVDVVMVSDTGVEMYFENISYVIEP